jgi:predicted nuclease of predicted toxin-antitoxin system
MNFIIDAQLPQQLVEVFLSNGCKCIHVMALPKHDKTPDREIRDYADHHKMIVVTKDFDFYHSHMSIQRPAKLLLITTDNIKNKQLLMLIENNIKTILKAFKTSHFVELSNEKIIIL